MDTQQNETPTRKFLWKGRTRSERVAFILDLLRTAGLLLTASSLMLSVTAFRWQQQARQDDYQWKRKEMSLTLLKTWNTISAQHRKEIAQLLTQIQGPGRENAVISKSTSWRLLKLNTVVAKRSVEEDRFWQLREDLVALLNDVDQICAAVQTGVADKSIIVKSLAGALKDTQTELSAFTNAADSVNQRATWPYFNELTLELNKTP
jgi:hypothetical protein